MRIDFQTNCEISWTENGAFCASRAMPGPVVIIQPASEADRALDG